MGGKLTQDEVVKTVEFCLAAFNETSAEERQKVLDKVAAINDSGLAGSKDKAELEKLSEEELKILNHIRAKQMLRFDDSFNVQHFGSDAIDGFAPNLKTGSLGLVPLGKDAVSNLSTHVLDSMQKMKDGESKTITAAA